MRFLRCSNFHVFDGKFGICFYEDDEYWSVFSNPDFNDFPVAIVNVDGEFYLWTDRVI